MKTKNGLGFFIIILGFLISFSSGFVNAAGTIPPSGSAPIIANAYVNQITSTSATLNGAVNPNGANATAWFEVNLGSTGFSSPVQTIGNSNNTSVVLTPYILNNLTSNTTYQFRTMANNSNGDAVGNWIYFTTGGGAVSIAPTLNKISPSVGNQGQNNLIASLTGTGFVNGSVVNSSNPDITVNSLSISSSTFATIDLSIGNNAQTGTGTVVLTNSNGTSNTISFKVIASPSCITPTISSISPSSVLVGTSSIAVTVWGSNFFNGTIGRYNGNSRPTGYVNSGELYITLNSSDLASTGTGNISVTNGSNYCTSNSVSFVKNPTSSGGGGGGGGYPHYVYVSTNIPENITKTSANLKGSINPNGSPSTAWFEYGTSSSFQTTETTPQLSAGAANTFLSFSQTINNLSPNTTYYLRAVGRNSAGTVNGNVYSFVTPKSGSNDDSGNITPEPNPDVSPQNPEPVTPKSDPFAGISNLFSQHKINISSAFIKWLGILFLVLIIALVVSKLKGKSKHEGGRD